MHPVADNSSDSHRYWAARSIRRHISRDTRAAPGTGAGDNIVELNRAAALTAAEISAWIMIFPPTGAAEGVKLVIDGVITEALLLTATWSKVAVARFVA